MSYKLLAATLLTLGRERIGQLLDHSMNLATRLCQKIEASNELTALSLPQSGVVCFRHNHLPTEKIRAALPPEISTSQTTINNQTWLRSVAANPNLIIKTIKEAAQSLNPQKPPPPDQ